MSTTVVMKYFIISLVLIQFVNARIDLVVDAISNKVDAFGSDIAIISDVERKTYRIDDYSLKAAVETAFGKWPTDVFVRSPTPWGDLYKSYSWKEVERTLTPTKTEILASKTESVTFDSKNFENMGTSPLEITAAIYHKEANTISHTWTKNEDISSGIKFNYKIKLPVSDSGSFMSVLYKNNWGNTKTESRPVTLGSISGVKFIIPSGTKATATLKADKTILETRVKYEVTLKGQAALNYMIPYQGHHFWGYDINSLLSQTNKAQKILSTEKLKITYFSKAKVVITDDATNNVISEINVLIDVTPNFSSLRMF